MSTEQLLSELRTLDIRLSVDGDRLRCSAPTGRLTREAEEKIAAHKLELLFALPEPSPSPQRILGEEDTSADRYLPPSNHVELVMTEIWHEVIPNLGQDQPVFGFRPRRIEGNSDDYVSIRDLTHRKLKIAPSTQSLETDHFYQAKVRYQRLLYSHTSEKYAGCITLLVNEKQARYDGDFGWTGIARDELEVHALPGDHTTILTQYGKEVAQVILNCIDDAFAKLDKAHRTEAHAS